MVCVSLFFFNDTATTEIYTLSLHDALPIYHLRQRRLPAGQPLRARRGHRPAAQPNPPPGDAPRGLRAAVADPRRGAGRSEEHTSELQSRQYLVCRLLLEKKKKPLSHSTCIS